MVPILTKPRWGKASSSSNSIQSTKQRPPVPKPLNNSIPQPPSQSSSTAVPPCESFEMVDFPVVIITPLTAESLAAHTKITNPDESKRCTRCRHCKRAMKPARVNESNQSLSPHHVPVAQSETVTARSRTGSRSLSTMSKSQLSSSQSRTNTSSSSRSKALNAGKETPRWVILLDSILAQSLI